MSARRPFGFVVRNIRATDDHRSIRKLFASEGKVNWIEVRRPTPGKSFISADVFMAEESAYNNIINAGVNQTRSGRHLTITPMDSASPHDDSSARLGPDFDAGSVTTNFFSEPNWQPAPVMKLRSPRTATSHSSRSSVDAGSDYQSVTEDFGSEFTVDPEGYSVVSRDSGDRSTPRPGSSHSAAYIVPSECSSRSNTGRNHSRCSNGSNGPTRSPLLPAESARLHPTPHYFQEPPKKLQHSGPQHLSSMFAAPPRPRNSPADFDSYGYTEFGSVVGEEVSSSTWKPSHSQRLLHSGKRETPTDALDEYDLKPAIQDFDEYEMTTEEQIRIAIRSFQPLRDVDFHCDPRASRAVELLAAVIAEKENTVVRFPRSHQF